MTGKEVRGLTGIRGVAAMAVMTYHVFPFDVARTGLQIFLNRNYMMVDLFFMLSGVVMAMNYSKVFSPATGFSAAHFKEFLLRRIGRIYPLYIFVTIAATAATSAIGHTLPAYGIGTYLANLFVIQSFGLAKSIVGPTWSISAEFAAYLALPLLLWPTTSKRAWVRILTFTAALILICVVSHADTGTDNRKGALDIWNGIASGWPVLRCIIGFTIGLLIHSARTYQWSQLVASNSLLSALCLLGLISLMSLPLPDVVVYPFLALLVFFCHGNSRFMDKVFGNAVVYSLGVWSYSIYLLHVPMMRLFNGRTIGQRYFGAPGYWSVIVGCYIVVIFSAWLTYRYIELPGKAWIASKTQRAPAADEASPAQTGRDDAAHRFRPMASRLREAAPTPSWRTLVHALTRIGKRAD